MTTARSQSKKIARNTIAERRRIGRAWSAGLALVFMTFAIYLPAVRGGEIWDDALNITQNSLLHDAHGLWEIWTDYRSMPAYYPVTHTNWWIDYHLFGLRLPFYHLENIAMHAASAVLIWLALRKLNITGAWLAAALWAVHPIHVESVAWITERKNTLSVLLYLISFHCYLRATAIGGRAAVEIRPPGKKNSSRPYLASASAPNRTTHESLVQGDAPLRVGWYIASVLFFAIALPAKTPVVTLPAAILLTWWYLRGDEPNFWRSTFRRETIRMIPFFLLGLCMGMATVYIEQHHSGARGPLFEFTPLQRFVLIGRSFWFYIWKVFWPARFDFIYPRWNILHGLSLQLLYPLAAVGLIVALLMLRRRLGRGPVSGVLFYAGSAFPALGIVPIYFHRYSLVSDHFAYLSNVGLTALAAWVIVAVIGRRWKTAMFTLAGVALAVLSVQSFRQARLYESNLTMWQDVIKKNPRTWMAHGNLAGRLDEVGRTAEAEEHFKRAIELDPTGSVESIFPYASFLARQGRIDEAIPLFERGLKVAPEYLNGYSLYAQALAKAGRTDEAIKIYQRGLANGGDPYEAGHVELADLYARLGRANDAKAEYTRAIEVDPKALVARVNLANLLVAERNIPGALQLFAQAVQIAPNEPSVRNSYGLLLMRLGNFPAAVEQFRQMVDLLKGQEGLHVAYFNLGTALQGAGQTSEAILCYERALAIKPDFEPAQRNLQRAKGNGQGNP